MLHYDVSSGRRSVVVIEDQVPVGYFQFMRSHQRCLLQFAHVKGKSKTHLLCPGCIGQDILVENPPKVKNLV